MIEGTDGAQHRSNQSYAWERRSAVLEKLHSLAESSGEGCLSGSISLGYHITLPEPDRAPERRLIETLKAAFGDELFTNTAQGVRVDFCDLASETSFEKLSELVAETGYQREPVLFALRDAYFRMVGERRPLRPLYEPFDKQVPGLGFGELDDSAVTEFSSLLTDRFVSSVVKVVTNNYAAPYRDSYATPSFTDSISDLIENNPTWTTALLVDGMFFSLPNNLRLLGSLSC